MTDDSTSPTIAAPGDWVCAARAGSTGPNDPQECDWPVCGCDPVANKVIDALEESGRMDAQAPDGVDERPDWQDDAESGMKP